MRKGKAAKRQFAVEKLLGAVRRRCGGGWQACASWCKLAAPKAEERVYRGWPLIAYDHKGLLCYIAPLKNGVNLGFYRGARLPDPDQLLGGTGKGLRHIKVRTAKDIRPAAFKKLVRAAYRLNAT